VSAPKTADTTTQLEIARHGAKNKLPSGQERKGGNERGKEIRQDTWSHFSQRDSSSSQKCLDDDDAEMRCVQCSNQMPHFFMQILVENRSGRYNQSLTS